MRLLGYPDENHVKSHMKSSTKSEDGPYIEPLPSNSLAQTALSPSPAHHPSAGGEIAWCNLISSAV